MPPAANLPYVSCRTAGKPHGLDSRNTKALALALGLKNRAGRGLTYGLGPGEVSALAAAIRAGRKAAPKA
jgi:hypothetical protein